MRDFWDAKARENAMYYISSYRAYDQQDPEEFWKWGAILAERFLGESGLRFTGGESMLEIGCGIGRMSKYFADRFGHVTAIDISPEMVRQAQADLRDLGNVRVEVGNGSDLSAYRDATFDFVFSYIVFQHIPDTRITLNYIREAGRVLRPGGHCYFQVNTMPRPSRVRAALGRLKRALLGAKATAVSARDDAPRDLDHPAWLGSRVTMTQVEEAVLAGGMRIERVQGEGTQYTWVLVRKA